MSDGRQCPFRQPGHKRFHRCLYQCIRMRIPMCRHPRIPMRTRMSTRLRRPETAARPESLGEQGLFHQDPDAAHKDHHEGCQSLSSG